MVRKIGWLALVGLMLFSLPRLNAQDNLESPIIARVGKNIYAVSPQDGTARLLVDWETAQNKAFEVVSEYIRPFLGPISPDQTLFAYTAPLNEILDPVYADKLDQLLQIDPNDITLVDIVTGRQTNITMQNAHFADAMSNMRLSEFQALRWSQDGQRLYFKTTLTSLYDNRAPQVLIEYYDMASKERKVFTSLNRRFYNAVLYPVPEGLIAATFSGGGGLFDFMIYDLEGHLLRTSEKTLNGLNEQNVMIYTMNPVYEADHYFYAYSSYRGEEAILEGLDGASGETTVLGEDLYTAFVSHENPTTSLRVVYANYYGMWNGVFSHLKWRVTDAQGHLISSMAVPHVSAVSEFALSPDGDRLAVLKTDEGSPYETAVPIVIMDVDGERELDFKANEIAWGAVGYVPTQILDDSDQ